MSDSLVVGTDFVCVSAPDHAESCSFYEEVLGLERSKSWGSFPATEFETGSLTIAVIDWTAFGRENAASANPIVLAVEDVPEAKAQLEARGVEFASDVIDSGSCHQAYFTDPGGNSLGIHGFYGERSRGS